jgi:hypothetical protein
VTPSTGIAILAARNGGRYGAAAAVIAAAYAPGGPVGRRAMFAAVARIGAAHAARRRAAAVRHAPPYPVPVVAWRGRAW